MKAKEKGFDPSDTVRGKNFNKQVKGFNAFREMGRLQRGETMDLAKIPPGMKVVGKAIEPKEHHRDDRDKKRSRDHDDQDRKPFKSAKLEVSSPFPWGFWS